MYEIFSCARYLAQQGENISSGHMVAVLTSKDLGRTSAPPTFQKLLANCHQDGKKCAMHAVVTINTKKVDYGYESRFKETVMVKMDMETFNVEHRWQNFYISVFWWFTINNWLQMWMFHLKSLITACSTELEFATGLFYLICCFEENVKQLADFKNIRSFKMGTL